jgi:hypothetical protein
MHGQSRPNRAEQREVSEQRQYSAGPPAGSPRRTVREHRVRARASRRLASRAGPREVVGAIGRPVQTADERAEMGPALEEFDKRAHLGGGRRARPTWRSGRRVRRGTWRR